MSEPPHRYSWEDYLYPPNESGVQVLRDKLGLREFVALDHAERQLTVLRASELIGRSDLAPRTFDAAHWKAIHRQIFQDVYEWAGEFRTVNISKNELIDGPDGKLKQQSNPFAHVDHLESDVDELMSQIRRTDMFAGRDAAAPSTGWPTP